VCLYINHCGNCRPLVSYSINFCSYEDCGKQREDPYNFEPTREGDIQMEFCSDSLCSSNIGVLTKDYVSEHWSLQVLSDNPEYSLIWHL
jgi:hypothetical protein